MHSDRDPLLNDLQQALLWQVRKQPPRDGGLWNGRKVADWMSELLGEKVCRQRGWEYLKSLGGVTTSPLLSYYLEVPLDAG